MKHRDRWDKNLTAEDWKALFFVWTLFQEVATHGKPALDTFIEAMRETKVR